MFYSNALLVATLVLVRIVAHLVRDGLAHAVVHGVAQDVPALDVVLAVVAQLWSRPGDTSCIDSDATPLGDLLGTTSS